MMHRNQCKTILIRKDVRGKGLRSTVDQELPGPPWSWEFALFRSGPVPCREFGSTYWLFTLKCLVRSVQQAGVASVTQTGLWRALPCYFWLQSSNTIQSEAELEQVNRHFGLSSACFKCMWRHLNQVKKNTQSKNNVGGKEDGKEKETRRNVCAKWWFGDRCVPRDWLG